MLLDHSGSQPFGVSGHNIPLKCVSGHKEIMFARGYTLLFNVFLCYLLIPNFELDRSGSRPFIMNIVYVMLLCICPATTLDAHFSLWFTCTDIVYG